MGGDLEVKVHNFVVRGVKLSVWHQVYALPYTGSVEASVQLSQHRHVYVHHSFRIFAAGYLLFLHSLFFLLTAMDFTDDWGSVGSTASEEEVKQPTVVSAPEGTAESTAPHPQPQIPSSSQIAALLSAGLNEPEPGEVILGPGQPSTSGGLIPEGSRPAQTTANPSKDWRRPVLEALRRIGQGYEQILKNQTTLSSATASSQCKSAIAVLRVDELEREKEEMRCHYNAQIKTMCEAMKEQLSVSKEAVSTINSLRRELAATQAESRKLHSELRDSKVILAPPAGMSSKPAGSSSLYRHC